MTENYDKSLEVRKKARENFQHKIKWIKNLKIKVKQEVENNYIHSRSNNTGTCSLSLSLPSDSFYVSLKKGLETRKKPLIS